MNAHAYSKAKATPKSKLPRLELTPRTFANLKHLEQRLSLDTIAVVSAAIDLLATVYPPEIPHTSPTIPNNPSPLHIATPLRRTLKRLQSLHTSKDRQP